jgi:hypothetical protein
LAPLTKPVWWGLAEVAAIYDMWPEACARARERLTFGIADRSDTESKPFGSTRMERARRGKRRIDVRTSLIIIAAIGALVVPTSAFAQTPTPGATGYGSTPVPIPPAPQQQVLGEVGEVEESAPSQEAAPAAGETPPAPQAQASPPVEQSADTLPFTGLDIGIVAGLGFVLLATGVVMRRTTRSRA